MKPLEIEKTQSELLAVQSVRQNFISGNNAAVHNMLKAMFEISQNRGKSKDPHIYCLKRAEKMACSYPEYESCLANGCPYLVFTKLGYIPLLKVLHEYYTMANNGDRKAYAVLEQVLLPRYQSIINQLVHDVQMTNEEKDSLKIMLKEYMNHE